VAGRLSLRMKGNLYATYMRSVMYDRETRGVREEDIHRFEHTEMGIVRWMNNATLR